MFWNNFNKPSRKTKYQSRLQILLWDGSQLEKSFHTKEYQTHSCTGRVKFTQFKLSRWNTLSSYYITLVSRLLSILKEKEQKSVHVHYNIPECQLHALQRKREKKQWSWFPMGQGGITDCHRVRIYISKSKLACWKQIITIWYTFLSGNIHFEAHM